MHYIQTTGDGQYDVHVYRADRGRLVAIDQSGNDVTALVDKNRRMTTCLTNRMLISQVPPLHAGGDLPSI